MATLVSYALTNVADVKESLGITNNSKDNLIIRKINAATDMIENYCGRRFASTVYTDETYDIEGGRTINLNNYPVISFTSLSERDTSQNINSWTTVNSEFYFVDTDAGIVELLYGMISGWQRYKVTYTAGYTTIPNDLAEACATLAGYLVGQNPTTIDSKSVQEGQRKQEFFDTSSSTADIFQRLGIADVIDSYATVLISGRQ